jgi:hypothetical protein
VCVCVGFVMRGCLGNMYTVLGLRFLVTWLKFLLPWLWFFHAFPSVVRQMPGQKTRKDGAWPALSHISCYFISVVICVACVLSGCKCVLPPGDNPIAVNKYYYYYNSYRLSNKYVQHITPIAILQYQTQSQK